LVILLYPRKNNPHVPVSGGISNLTERRERSAVARDSDPQFSSSREGFAGGYATAIQAKIGDSLLKAKVRLKVNEFDAGHKRITACPWTFNLYRILDFLGHTFIVRNDSRNGIVISRAVV
jgi:hypothetical protein